jgi:hypothetical protein
MHKNATKCNETLSKWCKNKHGASKIIDTLETYQAARGKARGRHGRNPWCGRRQSRGHGEAIGEISRTGRCVITRSTGCAPSQRLTPAGVAGIKGVPVAAIQSREPEQEEEKGACRLAGSGSDRASWSGSTRWVGTDRWASGPTGGPAADRWARKGF